MSLLLTCPAGLEDLVRGDLLERDEVRSVLAGPGTVRCDSAVERDRLPAMVDRVAVPLDLPDDGGTAAETASAVGEIPWDSYGLGASVTFRVHLPGSAEQKRRAGIIDAVQDRLGWRNDPSHWAVNLDLSREATQSGSARAELGPWAWAARYGAFERLPATTPGPVSAGLVRLAKLQDGQTLLDVCGGVGTVPVLDGMLRVGRSISVDNDGASVAAARHNIASHGLGGRVEVIEADAADLPLPDGSVDRVVSDLPFGKRIGSNELNRTLYPAILREIERVLTADGRCVLLSDDKRVFAESVAKARGLKIVGERVIRYNGVTPTAYIVRRSRRPKSRGRMSPGQASGRTKISP
ncbi:methyltransferase domain-containing protein [Flexivirga caeni]|uniref:RNA methyltransferase n=1 Tax=Flexivirga caeni TaxID=2294115 RepID=A0A3M9M842_9MICO|nr:methyltransferase domain-containing protein [Flexivirga caeni]RNI21375.1 RNA methyltransferase [Flexivirga caeni]